MWTQQQLNQFDGVLFKKLIALIEKHIEQGLLIPDEKLPAERELAKKLQINRSTVVHALDQLTERGILVRKRGSGTFVNAKKWGLQVYPTINWHLPTNFNKTYSVYQQKTQQRKDQAIAKQQPLCDLANGDLPVSLMPKLTLPEMTSQELVYQEKNSDMLQTGLPSLKSHIANYMQQQFNMSVSQDEILITSGTQQALFLITQGLLKPGDAIGVEAPSYFYSLPLFQAAGVRIYGIKMDHEGIVIDDLQKTHDTFHLKWIFLNPVFQNPTGTVMSERRKQAVLSFCYQACIGIVEDDAYSALYFDSQVNYHPIKKVDNHNQVIYLGSLSKYIGKSIRIGWMVAPTKIIQRLAEIRQHIDSGLSILPQLLAEDYLQHHYQYHQDVLRHQLKIKRDQLIEQLNAHYPSQITYCVPQGGFHLYAHLNVKNNKQFDEFLNIWLAKSILVAKGENFGDSIGNIRLSYGHFLGNLL
ncbi:PLP-dependent aminotransferase family protein [Orbus sasakiae]|uniref:PLP-dependent aminotransferase family protein n=1 Tax=Orbus sasakiae TaxID=1078475 RepID=A0ABP9N8T0_9GAMM